MEQHKQSKTKRLAAVGGALAALAFFLALSAGSAPHALADAHPGVNLSASVPGYAGCDTSSGDAQCYIPPGTTFTVNVTLGALPSDVSGYQGIDIQLNYSGVTSQNNGDVTEWSDCVYPAYSYDTPGVVTMACAIGAGASDSTYSGIVGTIDFTCAASGTISLEHGNTLTDIIQSVSQVLWEPGTSETLNITCGSPPTATPPSTATPQATSTPVPGLGSTGSGGSLQSGGEGSTLMLLLGAAVATVAAAGTLSIRTWRMRRS